jgi:hypothetical protein
MADKTSAPLLPSEEYAQEKQAAADQAERASLRRQIGNLLAQYVKYGVISHREMTALDDHIKKTLSGRMRAAGSNEQRAVQALLDKVSSFQITEQVKASIDLTKAQGWPAQPRHFQVSGTFSLTYGRAVSTRAWSAAMIAGESGAYVSQDLRWKGLGQGQTHLPTSLFQKVLYANREEIGKAIRKMAGAPDLAALARLEGRAKEAELSDRAAADERKWFVTKRGGSPYGGPAWKSDTHQWFDSKKEAEAMAKTLGERNPVGFSVEQIPKGFKAGKYPRMEKA